MYSRPRIIPCLTIENHDLVKTTNFKNPRYLGDPVNAVKIFNDKGVDELCILDINAGSAYKKPQMDYLEDIASEAFMPLSYGGGITNLDEIREIFYMGYEKVIINTAFFENPQLITRAADIAGTQSIVVSIDVKTDFLGRKACYSHGGKKKVQESPLEAVKRAEKAGAGEILLNSIDNDGRMQGYDISLVRQIADAVSIPVIACGGAYDVNSIKAVLTEGHAHAAAGSSMFVFYGDIKAVLITFPTEKELIDLGLYDKL